MLEIDHLEFKQLAELRQRIDARMKEMREQSVPELRNRFAEEAATLGLSLDDILGKVRKKRGRPPAHAEPTADVEA